MLALLNDQNTYLENKHDPTSTIQNKINKLIKNWKDKKQIDNNTAKRLMTYNGIAPRIYGLPKVHKTNMPLRPIVSNILAPRYNISKWLTEILKNVINANNLSIKDSWQFKKYISDKTLPNDHILCRLVWLVCTPMFRSS